MSQDQAGVKTFSDSWHRVATVRAALRSSVVAHRQFFRGEAWVVLSDQFGHDWFRVSPDAYAFLCRLGEGVTVEQAWERCLAIDPEHSLTQEEVVQLLGQLQLSNLLQHDRADAQASQYQRFQKRKTREWQALLMGFLSIKVPLFDPDRALTRALPLLKRLFGPWGWLFYGLLLLSGAKAVADESDRLFGQSAGLLAPSNLGLLYLGFLFSKTLHEFSHAAVCKWFGGQVHKMGVMLLSFAPIPYVDATAAWGFRNRWHRVAVGAAGVLAELGLAAVAAWVWSQTAPGTLNALAYDVMFVASVSTLVFNLNPLLRFDGYHILVDLIGVPNLFQRSREQLQYLTQRYVLRLPQAQPAARTPAEVFWLPIYGITSVVYWVFLMVTIIVLIANEYLDLGVFLAGVMFCTSVLWPLFKAAKYLLQDPSLGFQRGQAQAIALGGLALLLGLLLGVPWPDRLRVTGVLEAQQSRQLHTETEGFFVELLARPGSTVAAGQALLRLDNPQLAFEQRVAQMQREQLWSQKIQAVSRASVDLSAIERQLQAVEQQLLELQARQAALLIRAPMAGVWSASELDSSRGQWLARGAAVGTVVNGDGWRFVAVLPQVGSHALNETILASEVRLHGEEGANLRTLGPSVMPFEQGVLPSRALGMAGGGELAVSPSDPNGTLATEPFFRIEARLPAEEAGLATLAHGRVGTMRLTLSSKPLAVQWARRGRQFLQRRFRV